MDLRVVREQCQELRPLAEKEKRARDDADLAKDIKKYDQLEPLHKQALEKAFMDGKPVPSGEHWAIKKSMDIGAQHTILTVPAEVRAAIIELCQPPQRPADDQEKKKKKLKIIWRWQKFCWYGGNGRFRWWWCPVPILAWG